LKVCGSCKLDYAPLFQVLRVMEEKKGLVEEKLKMKKNGNGNDHTTDQDGSLTSIGWTRLAAKGPAR
jgi:hypothetical protein